MGDTTQGQGAAVALGIALVGAGVVLIFTPGVTVAAFYVGCGLLLLGSVVFLMAVLDIRRTRPTTRREVWATIGFYRDGSARLERSENTAAVLPQDDRTYRIVWTQPFADTNYLANVQPDTRCTAQEELSERRPDSILIFVTIWDTGSLSLEPAAMNMQGPPAATVVVTASGPTSLNFRRIESTDE